MEEGVTAARESPSTKRRIDRSTLRDLVQQVPGDYPPPDHNAVVALGDEYQQITGKRVTPKMHGLLAKALRVQGPSAHILLRLLYDERRSTTNLLADLISSDAVKSAPNAEVATAQPAVEAAEPVQDPAAGAWQGRWDDLPIDDTGCFIGLTYGPHNRPPFDPTSRKRYDRRALH